MSVSPTPSPSPRPAKGFIHIGENHQPWIAGFRCSDCGAVQIEQTMACRRCTSRNAAVEFRASGRGCIHTYTVVQRSFPGVKVPFVSVVVDLDDGLTLKGTLRATDFDLVRVGMPVKLVFDDAGGATDTDGVPYVGFHFLPLPGDKQ